MRTAHAVEVSSLNAAHEAEVTELTTKHTAEVTALTTAHAEERRITREQALQASAGPGGTRPCFVQGKSKPTLANSQAAELLPAVCYVCLQAAETRVKVLRLVMKEKVRM